MPTCLKREGAVFRLLLLVLLVSCSTTITKIKEPVFAISTDSLGGDLASIVTCEHFQVEGKDIVTNGRDSTVLEIRIINGKDIPTDQYAQASLGAYVASRVKGALQDKDAYGNYAVLFVRMKTAGGVTERNWTGRIFASAAIPARKREKVSGESFLLPCHKWDEEMFGTMQGLDKSRFDSASNLGFTTNYQTPVPYEVVYVYKADVQERERLKDSLFKLLSKECRNAYPDFDCYAFVLRMMNPDKMPDMHEMNITFPTPVKVYKRLVGDKWSFLGEVTVQSFEEYSTLRFNTIYGHG